jgi:aminopeptidase N
MASSMRDDRDILPNTVQPINYGISIYDIELGGAFSYQGTVSITAKVLLSTESITLNSHQLKIHGSKVLINQSLMIKSSKVSYNVSNQRATLEFPEELPVSDDVLIVIEFQGTINNDMAGFYRSKYKPAVPPAASVPKDKEFHYMFSTQFESSDARRAFPCFDEPNLKATFDIEIEIPDDQVALSNMPEKSVRRGKDGVKVVAFERTPIMSTYLVAWAIGDFEYVEALTKRKYEGKNLSVRVYTTKGLKEQARFALEHAHQIVDYFSDIFKIDYPLPKVDLLAVHEFVRIYFTINHPSPKREA